MCMTRLRGGAVCICTLNLMEEHKLKKNLGLTR